MRYFFALAVGLSLFMGLAAQTESSSACLDELFQERNIRPLASYDSLLLNCGQALMGYDSLADFALPELVPGSETENPSLKATAFHLTVFRAYGERRRRNYDASNAILESLLEAVEKEEVAPDQKYLTWAALLLGRNNLRLREWAEGTNWMDRGLVLVEKYFQEPDSLQVELLLLKAAMMEREGRYETVEQAELAYHRRGVEDSLQLFDIQVKYSNSADAPFLGVLHADAALAIGRKLHGEDNNKMALLYFNTASLYRLLYQYEKAISYLSRAALFIETKTSNHYPLIHIWSNLATVYREIGEYEKSIDYFKKANELSKEFNGVEQFWQGLGYLQLAEVQILAGSLEAGEESLQKCQEILVQFPNESSYLEDLSNIQAYYGNISMAREEYELAAQHYQASFELDPYSPDNQKQRLDQLIHSYVALAQWSKVDSCLQRGYGATPYTDAASLTDLYLIDNEPFLEIILTEGRILAQQFQRTGDLAALEQSKEVYQRFFRGVSALQRERPETKSIANFRNKWYPAYAEAIEIFLLEEPNYEEVFALLEESTNSLLLGQLRSYRMPELSGIEAAQFEQEEAWQDSLLALRQERLAATEDSPNFIIRETNFNDSLDQLRRNFAAANPQWYRLRYEQANCSLAEVQAQLEPDELLLHFRADEGSLYVFSASQDASMMQSLAGWDQRQLETYIGHLNQTEAISTSIADELARSLYQQLLEEVLNQYGTTIQQLTIIPDGQLYQLPFESLQTSAGDWLMEHYVIRYATSASVLLEQMAMNPQARRSFLGVAPDYPVDIATTPLDTSADEQLALLVRSGEYALPGAQQEVRQIQESFGGQTLLGAEAQKDEFLTKANNYRVLHLAMHGLLDQDDPLNARLLFGGQDEANTYLTAAEIYQQSLQAQLAVLSACNTGSGQLSKGEGVMSLARAFTYAGVPSTVTSLWQVPDASTATIMSNFYDGLKNGMPKDVALQQAKLAYLNSVEETPELQQPYYWAGFVLNGNRAALTRTNGSGRWWYLLGALMVLGGLWARAKR